jgi:regulator of nonsense transcripts 2
VLKDLKSLNLTKYVSEIAAALVEAKLKMTDVQAAVNICLYLHRHYSEFTPHLHENWQKALSFKKDEKVKKRFNVRIQPKLVS